MLDLEKYVGNVTEIAHRELKSPTNGEQFSLSAVLSENLGFEKIFVHHEIIPSGRRSSAPHRHSAQEEMVFVLRGQPTVHLGSRTLPLKPGDFLGFHPTLEDLHFVENTGTEDAELLVIASKGSANDTVYGDTNG